MAVWLDTLELAGFARRVVLTAGQAGQFGMKGTCSEHATGHNVDVSKAKVSVRASVIVTIVCLASLDLCGVSYGGETRSSSSQSGSPGHPQILTCSEEATQFTGTLLPAGPHDLIFGPGYFPEARSLATESPQHFAPGAHGTYKLPPVVDPGSTVTMTVALNARSYVVQQNPWSSPAGSQSVTYEACPGKPGFFPQSFRFTDGRLRGCVPIDVRVGGQRTSRRIVLSLFAGRCGTNSTRAQAGASSRAG